ELQGFTSLLRGAALGAARGWTRRSVVPQLDEEGGVTRRRCREAGAPFAGRRRLERRAGPGFADHIETEVARARVGGLPQQHLAGAVVRSDHDRLVLQRAPLEARPRPLLEHVAVERENGVLGIAPGEVVLGVGDIAQMFLAQK